MRSNIRTADDETFGMVAALRDTAAFVQQLDRKFLLAQRELAQVKSERDELAMRLRALESAVEQLDQPRWVTTKRLAAYLDCSVQTIWRWRQDGRLPEPIKVGETNRFDMQEVTEHLQSLPRGV